ncbi:MAG: twin-arginine translocase subunit TatC [Bdellovibrionales bacterium]
MNNPETQAQSIVEHLTELRIRVTRALYGIALGFAVCYNFSEHLMEVIRKPIQPFLGTESGGLVFLGVMDKFLAHIKVSLLAGVILSCPWWLYQAWKFIAPGLYEGERRYATGFIFFGSLLFAAGVLFAYFLVYPAAFKFLLNFGGTTDTPMITLGEYLSFFVTTTLVFGAAFELPLIITILGLLGIVDEKLLRSKRRYAIVILAVLSAVVTPPDALSMFMLLVPMVLLYELSIFLVQMLKRPRATALTESE